MQSSETQQLEFLLIGHRLEIAALLDEIPDHVDDGSNLFAFRLIHQALTKDDSIQVYDSDRPLSLWGHEQPTNAEAYRKWGLAVDVTVRPTDEEESLIPADYMVGCVELKSPIYSMQHDNPKDKITRVLRTLHSHLNSGAAGASTIRLLTNETCGLHVHVGKSADGTRVFSLSTLKRFYTLATGFERLLDQLHSADRILSVLDDLRLPRPACSPPSARFLGDPPFRRVRAGGPLAWCRAVDAGTRSERDMARWTAFNRFVAYNLNNLTPRCADAFAGPTANAPRNPFRKWTLEFRQHRGTLDAGEVVAWIDVVAALMRFAERAGAEAVSVLLSGRVEDPGFGPLDLLKAVDVPAETVEFYDKLMRGVLDSPPVLQNEAELNALLEHNYAVVAHARSPQVVRNAVGQKLRDGHYGNFEESVLKALVEAVEK